MWQEYPVRGEELHVKEMCSELSEAVLFLKPSTTYAPEGAPVLPPPWTVSALCLDTTARDVQEECKKKGLPGTLAKSFKAACPRSLDSAEPRTAQRTCIIRPTQAVPEATGATPCYQSLAVTHRLVQVGPCTAVVALPAPVATSQYRASCLAQAVCLAHTPSLEDQQCIKDL
ncbi:hypothetical protein A6R68_03204 [Neotoma lepida]|uniref:Uncharacterized protein n=1 Tax=Neotoma lepida TaxID=56216 RepID=A0A1A6GRE7_NEOLE|nr:hypothetical protein A6R68_03204 [Neotoma lepida]